MTAPPKKTPTLEGRQFGRLYVVCFAYTTGQHTWWVCRCKCKCLTLVRQDRLKSGATTSCGCKQLEFARKILKWTDRRIRAMEEEALPYFEKHMQKQRFKNR